MVASEKCRNTGERNLPVTRRARMLALTVLSPYHQTLELVRCSSSWSAAPSADSLLQSKTCSRTSIVMVGSRLAWKKALTIIVPLVAWRLTPRRTRHDDATAQHKHSLICRPSVEE